MHHKFWSPAIDLCLVLRCVVAMFWAGFRMLSVKKSGGALPPLMKNKGGDVPPPP